MSRASSRRRRSRSGFTLIELGIVVTIIGILIAFVLVASYEGVQRAQIRATQGLISKLDAGITERLEALLQQSIQPNGAHRFLAAIYPPGGAAGPWGLPSEQRAYVIATFDYLKAEMPDVFIYDPTAANYSAVYPLNFAAQPYPAGATGLAAYLLPLGHTDRAYRYGQSDVNGPLNGPGDGQFPVTATGVLGASWAARAAFNKLLGYSAQGYDQADNDGNGYVDELTPAETGMSAAEINAIHARLANHTHKTARAEALYALLVGGLGPLGSVFTPEEFSPTEVGDTDGDGLPEFIDAWGEPLQFYRWPIHHVALPLQRGWRPYPPDPFTTREKDPLDPNNHLVAPAWWANAFNIGAPIDPFNSFAADPLYAYRSGGTISSHAAAFMYYFHSIAEFPYPPGARNSTWSRSLDYPRRAYFSRPLIISAGPDKELGVGQLALDYSNYTSDNPIAPGSAVPVTPSTLIVIENAAGNLSPFRDTSTAPYFAEQAGNPSAQIKTVIQDPNASWGLDDISNLNLTTAVGGIPQ
jgi:prepilin-type N-terminal cleavage/methylation domain-containing protein